MAQMQKMPDQREGKQRQRAESENRGDGERRVFVVGVDGPLGGYDGDGSADRRAQGEERSKLRLQAKHAAEERHERNGTGNFNGHENKADSTKFENIPEKKPRAEQNDASLQPEFVSGYAGSKNLRDAHGVRDGQTKNNRPENVFDVG